MMLESLLDRIDRILFYTVKIVLLYRDDQLWIFALWHFLATQQQYVATVKNAFNCKTLKRTLYRTGRQLAFAWNSHEPVLMPKTSFEQVVAAWTLPVFEVDTSFDMVKSSSCERPDTTRVTLLSQRHSTEQIVATLSTAEDRVKRAKSLACSIIVQQKSCLPQI